MTESFDIPSGLGPRLRTALVWVVGHAPRFLPFLVLTFVGGLTWQALSRIHPSEVQNALHGIRGDYLALAAALTVLNIGVMGLYDVLAFRRTRTRAIERWRYGAVAFAWSNFLTLGPFAGPAIRFWLYRQAVAHSSELEVGVASITISFAGGLAAWTATAVLLPPAVTLALGGLQWAVSLAVAIAFVYIARRLAVRFERFDDLDTTIGAACTAGWIGWLDWLLAAWAFVLCLNASGAPLPTAGVFRTFFLGQAVGLISLIPGGFGSSDAFSIGRLPLPEATSTAALVAYRLIYYILPWATASLVLLSWATRRAIRRIELARRLVAGLVGAGGALILLSTASPALFARLELVEQLVPLPLVEASHVTAALMGLLLFVLARGLAKGYRAALGATIIVLVLAALSALLKGLDYEEALILTGLAAAAWSQSALFDRPSHGRWLDGRDVALAALALALFLVFGALFFRLTPDALGRVKYFGYRFERARYVRSAGSLALMVSAGALYVLFRVPVRFSRLSETDVDRVLEVHATFGHDTAAMMVANGDKAVFFDGDRGFCLYRTIGPYLAVFSDPVVSQPGDRGEFLNALFAFAREIDRRPLFYQISLEWIPPLHDRGYAFFKLGEEAHVPLDQATLDGPAGKLYRQVLRRGERDRLRLSILPPYEVPTALHEMRAVSDDWLASKGARERQFSIGFFDETYLCRFPCVVVKHHGRMLAFANLLRGPRKEELSVDLMRYRSEGPAVMDFLFVSLLLYGKEQGYKRFNLGMAPLASVGQVRGAHVRERLARLLFQHGENWYNFQGLRFYKEKWNPVWVPRYMAYPNPWEWPAAITNVSALIAGGWARVVLPRKREEAEVIVEDGASVSSRLPESQ